MIKFIAVIAGAVALLTATYFKGSHDGRTSATAAQVPGLIQTIEDADTKAGELQRTLGDLQGIGSAVTTSIEAVNTAADEANRRLADAGVMADCPVFTERDVRLWNAEIDRIEATAGVSVR